MPRLTGSVFRDLAIWMAGFGLFVGVVFPPFMVLLGIDASIVISAWFYAACLVAGLIVGVVNYTLARLVVGRRLAVLTSRMGHVAENVREATYSGNWLDCDAGRCRIDVDSDDELGASVVAFNQLVGALEHSRAVEAAVSRLFETFASELDADRLSRDALDQILELTGCDGGALLVVTDGELVLRASLGIEDPGRLVANRHVAKALRTGDAAVMELADEVRVDGLFGSIRPLRVLVSPITFESAVMGVVVLAASSSARPDARRLVGLLRPALGLALHNAMAHERLQHLAALDPLTDVYNRRFGMGRLHEEFTRARRDGASLGVLMLDLDRFKRVNDTHGHLVGDRALRAVARALGRMLRDGDVLVRYGGDEFLAVLPGADPSDLVALAERLRRAVAATSIEDDGVSIAMTVSIGAAAIPACAADDETALVGQADDALCEAKRLGRNRVTAAACAGRTASVEALVADG